MDRALAHSPSLLQGTLADLRKDALAVAIAGLAAADPGTATARVVSYDTASDTLTVDGQATR